MLWADDTCALSHKAPIEIVQPLAQENALSADQGSEVWQDGVVDRSGIKPVAWPLPYGGIVDYRFGADFNRTETAPTAPFPTEQWVQVLRTEMQQFQERTDAEVARLSSAVEKLALAVSAIQSTYVEDEGREEAGNLALDADSALELPDGDLAAALNYLADDKDVWNSQWEQIALSKMDAQSPRLRAASARAIAAHNQTLAESVLTTRLQVEVNKFVGSIVRSALAAARA